MPELPDVEKHRRRYDEHAAGRAVRSVEVPDPEILEGTSPQGLGRSLTGRTLAPAHRHGKWLLCPTEADGPKLVVHFKMTGSLTFHVDGDRTERDAVILVLDGGEMRYRTIRRMGRVHWLPAGADPSAVTSPLGPDALEVDADAFADLLAGRRGGIKSALMDQELIAGLGNELVDDILFRSRLHPRSPVSDLDRTAFERIHSSMREVLRQSVRAGHVPSGPTWINGQRAEDDPRCPDCNTTLEKDQVAGRPTYWCPEHQSKP